MKILRSWDAIPSKIADVIVRRPFVVLVFLLGLSTVAAFYARHVRFDFNPDAVFGGDKKLVAYAEQFRREFGYDDTVIIIGLEAVGKADILSPASLTWQATAVRELEGRPGIKHVDSLISMKEPRVTFSMKPEVSYESIIDQIPVSADTADRLREALSETELPFGSIVSKDLRMCALLVSFQSKEQDFETMQRMVQEVDDTVARHPVPEGYRLLISGLPVLRVNIVRDLQKDQVKLMPLAGLLYLITLAISFRSASGSLLPLFAVGQGLLWTIGVLAARGQPLNIISNILPCMLLINGVSNSVHVLTRYAEEAVYPGVSLRDASRRTMRQMMVACLGAFSTAAIGFYSLHSASSPVLKEFGTQAAMGLSFLYVTVILTLGALLPFFRPPAFQEAGNIWMAFSRGFARIGCRIIHRPWLTSGVFLVIAAAALWRARTVEINSTTLETYDETHPAIQTLHTLERRLSGLLPLEVSLDADTPGLFYRPDIFRKVSELQHFAAAQKVVLFTRSYIDYFNEINSRFVSGENLNEELPRVDAEGRHRIERGRLFIARVADQMQYHNFVTRDQKRARLLLKVRDAGTAETLRLVKALDAKIAELFPPGSGIHTQVTGDAYVTAVGLTEMIHELLEALVTASLVIFGIVALLFRSLRIGLITIPPNAIPLVVTFGYMGLRGFDLNAGNVIVFTISLGIAVDNTIHYVLRFREEYAHDPDMAMATWKTMMGKSQPMFLSTFLIVIGLAVLLLSEFLPTRRFAELTIVTLTGALVGSLFLLPACVALLWRRRSAGQGGTNDADALTVTLTGSRTGQNSMSSISL